MKSDDQDRPKVDATIVDLASFRKKKSLDEELTRGGRTPLHVSHATGKVTGSPHLKGPENPTFGDRLQRIRTSLEKINKLMSELKKMSADGEAPAAGKPSSQLKS